MASEYFAVAKHWFGTAKKFMSSNRFRTANTYAIMCVRATDRALIKYRRGSELNSNSVGVNGEYHKLMRELLFTMNVNCVNDLIGRVFDGKGC
jgi:hypothetical protein